MILEAMGVLGEVTGARGGGLAVILLRGRKRPQKGAQAKYWVLQKGEESWLLSLSLTSVK